MTPFPMSRHNGRHCVRNEQNSKTEAAIHGLVEVTNITGISTYEVRIVIGNRESSFNKGDEVVAQ